MSAEEFGPLRSRASRKPQSECPNVIIYRCVRCGNLYQPLLRKNIEQEQPPFCCDAPMQRLKPLRMEALPVGLTVDYVIVGGFNSNAVQVFWENERPEDRPEWIMLKTFTGYYLRYPPAGKVAPLIFPLADEDAYVYCDRPVCERCIFRCKLGMSLYFYFKNSSLLEMPMDKMKEYFQKTT